MTIHDPIDTMQEVKQLMADIDRRLANDDVFTMRRTLDELTLAVNLLIGLVEGHRHQYWSGGAYETTGPMQACE